MDCCIGSVAFALAARCPGTYLALMVEVSALYLDDMRGLQYVGYGEGYQKMGLRV